MHTYFEVTISAGTSDDSKDWLINNLKDRFNPELTSYKNVFLVKMEHFKDFLSQFSLSENIGWYDISKSEYYDWDIECLIIGKRVLNWEELVKNRTTWKLIQSQNFPPELHSFLPDVARTKAFHKKSLEEKSVFLIKEYTGPLSYAQYFDLVRDVEPLVQSCFYPARAKLVWLASYTTWKADSYCPFHIMQRERLEFELSEFDYILAFTKDTSVEGTNSKIALDIALNQGLQVSYTLDELKAVVQD